MRPSGRWPSTSATTPCARWTMVWWWWAPRWSWGTLPAATALPRRTPWKRSSGVHLNLQDLPAVLGCTQVYHNLSDIKGNCAHQLDLIREPSWFDHAGRPVSRCSAIAPHCRPLVAFRFEPSICRVCPSKSTVQDGPAVMDMHCGSNVCARDCGSLLTLMPCTACAGAPAKSPS